MNKALVFLLLALIGGQPLAAMNKQQIVYEHDGTQLRGFVFWDDAFEGKRPAVLVFHEWWGLNDYALLRAEMLAESGYIAFAADMYGDGKKTRHAADAKSWMMQITANSDQWQARARLALNLISRHERVDSARIAAIGYCFGGATVMQLAYTGAAVKGVISVHGTLPPATPGQADQIRASVLVLHGGSDGFIPAERIEKFSAALTAADVDWEMNTYGGAQHGFSNPYADGYGIEGVAYQEAAEQRSWQRSLMFLEDLFSPEDF